MLIAPSWERDPASPLAGDEGPLTIRTVEAAPVRCSVCVILGSVARHGPDGQCVQSLDEDDITAARLILAAPKMRRALQALIQWARLTGGWDACCWREAERVLAETAGTQAPAEER